MDNTHGYAAVIALASLLLATTSISLQIVILFAASLALVVSKGNIQRLFLIIKNLKRDVATVRYTNAHAARMDKFRMENKLLRDLLNKQVERQGNKVAFVDADDVNKKLTFNQVQELAHKIANTFYARGYRKGDVVGLFMENRIEHVVVWLGLNMIGVITSLINYNIRGDSLKHCISVGNCKALIFTGSLVEAVKEVEHELSAKLFLFDNIGSAVLPESWECFDSVLESASSDPPPRPPDVRATDTLMYMYTSGTTGMPKAVLWSTMKNVSIALGYPLMYGLSENDTVYIALPLYHATSMIVANTMLFNGGTTVVKKKFSASRYIEDCSRHGVTVINYIGEICRYLLSQPPKEADTTNVIRLAMGSGLRASIWNEFKERFQIDKVIEFYGSTEGNARPFPNVLGKVGAVGFQPLLFPNKNFKLIQMDDESGEILRDAHGIALEAVDGQPGQVVGKITEANRFDGYTNKEAKEKKIGHDIFELGDSAFLSGDILVRDAEGYFYFHDRTGDTFRWKSENVSTNEVEGLISKIVKLQDVCVYGVPVPGNEGKAGMACILDPQKQLVIDDLPQQLDKVLPKYAHPQFLRLSTRLDLTSTFKFQKNKVRKEGFDPAACGDDVLHYFSKKEGKYLILTEEGHKSIMAGAITF